MTQLSDEILVAYADGELIGEDAEAVERALEGDRQAQETLRMFLETAELSRAAFDDIVREPVPGHLIETIAGTAPAAAPRRRVAVGGGLAGLALAASITLVLGLVSGFGLSNLVGDDAVGSPERWVIGTVAAHGDGVNGLLESLPSGHLQTVAAVGGSAEIMPLTTFVDHGGRYCRDFQATLPGGGDAAFGVACRSAAGAWRIEALVAAPAPTASGTYVTAAGPSGDPFTAVLDSLAAGAPLAAEEEARLLEQGWR